MNHNKFINSKNIKKIIDEHHKKDAEIFSLKNTYNTYDFSYNILLAVFKDLKTSGGKDKLIIAGSSLVYSWMPTILNFSKGSTNKDQYDSKLKDSKEAFDRIEEKINNDRNEKNLNFKDLDQNINTLSSFINNSIVGTSKFLHFTFPETFPIWDSRVEKATRYENGIYKNKNDYRTRNINNYIAYCIAVHDIIKNDKEFLKKLFDDKDHIITDIRKIEYALFLIGGK